MGIMVMKLPLVRARDRFVGAILALALPSIALGDGDLSMLVPPGATTQLRLCLNNPDPNEPTPIIVDQIGPDFGALGITLLGASEAAGTAVTDGNSMIIRTVSPSAAPGLSSHPMIAVTVAVSGQASTGANVNLTLGGAASPLLDPSATSCVPDLVNQGGSTVSGAASITELLPGSGLLPAGSLVAVLGVGFQPGAKVLIDGVSLASTSWVNSSRIEVVTAVDAQLDGKYVSVTNPDLTGATYFSSIRATDLGLSAKPLLAATQAIFPVQTQSSTVFVAPASGTFFGLALQNPGPGDSIVSIELLNAGFVVGFATIELPPNTKLSREVSELFPGVSLSSGSLFWLTATAPIQTLGLSGDETHGSVTPVLPMLASP